MKKTVFLSLLGTLTFSTVVAANSVPPLFPVSQATKSLRLDVNDIAYLWPTAYKGDNGLRYIPVFARNRSDDLVPNRSDFNKLTAFSVGFGTEAVEGSNQTLLNTFTGLEESIAVATDSLVVPDRELGSFPFFVSSFRVDDCGAGLHQGNDKTSYATWNSEDKANVFMETKQDECVYMLRLVASPESDAAIHLIYTFKDKKIFEAMVADLQYLKSQSATPTDGKVLSIHPGFLHPQKGIEFSRLVAKFVKHYAKTKNLTNIAFLTNDESGSFGDWNFFEAEINHDQNGLYTGFSMKTLFAKKTPTISQGFSFSSDPDSIRNELPKIAFATKKSEPADLQKMIDPSQTFTSNQDCLGCHSVAKEVVFGRYDFAKVFPVASSYYFTDGVTGFPDPQFLPDDVANFRAFGWFRALETVNMAVAVKAGAVAGSINKRLFGNSAANAKNYQGQQHQVIQCILANARKNHNCLN
ncbi:hypothetical protein MEO40_06990 [Dolichospermum sp. ST_sed1]|nr:hypothetical protein [Dolichospermum sp. ST_sed1]